MSEVNCSYLHQYLIYFYVSWLVGYIRCWTTFSNIFYVLSILYNMLCLQRLEPAKHWNSFWVTVNERNDCKQHQLYVETVWWCAQYGYGTIFTHFWCFTFSAISLFLLQLSQPLQFSYSGSKNCPNVYAFWKDWNDISKDSENFTWYTRTCWLSTK